MNYLDKIYYSRKPNKFFGLSILFHLTVFFFLLFNKSVSSLIFSPDQPEIIEEIIRVDVVGLPRLTQQELKQLENAFEQSEKKQTSADKGSLGEDSSNNETSETNKPEEALKDKPNDDQTDNSPNSTSALDLIRSLSKEKGVRSSGIANRKRSAEKSKIKTGKLKKLIIEGNKISKGTSVKGRYQADVAEFDQYVLNLPNIVRPFWKLPSFLKENALKARVIIYINSEGRVIHYRFVEKSSNEEFDSRVLKSIQQSQPFPVPGEEIRDRLISEGVILGFPL